MVSQGEIGSWKQQFSAHAQPVHKHNITHTRLMLSDNPFRIKRSVKIFKQPRYEPQSAVLRRKEWGDCQDQGWQTPGLCRTLSLIASEARSSCFLNVWARKMICVSKYWRQSWSSVGNFFSSISPASVLLWQWQVFTKSLRILFSQMTASQDLIRDFKIYLKYTFKNEKSFYFHRHLASWWRLIHYLCWWQHLTDERSPGPTSVTWLWVSCIKSG